MRIPFNGPAYRLVRELPQSAQRCLNLYLQIAERPSKTPSMLIPTPGLRRVATVGDGPIRGLLVAKGLLWVVSGRDVYKVRPDYIATPIGTISTLAGAVSMSSNGLQILIVDGLTGYTIDLAAETLAQITDPDFPAGVTSCTYIDGFFIVCGDGTQIVAVSTLLDGSTWDGLDVVSAEGAPDAVIACIADHRELWLFGSNTTEIFQNTGQVPPFERVGNAFIEHGCAAPLSVAKLDNTVYWLGQDDRGEGTIWRAQGYTPQRISTHAIEQAIAQYSRIDDAVAYTYQDVGHNCYVLSFPSGNATWVFDVSTGEWHERGWRDPLTAEIHRHRGQVQAFFNREQILGDWEDGRLYAMDSRINNDDGDIILRLRSTQAASEAQDLGVVVYGRLQVDVQAGVGNQSDPGLDPVMMMRYSDNGGRRWSNIRHAPLGRAGEYWRRCKWERCYSKGATDGRSRVWEVSWTDPVITGILGAVAQAEKGTG